jgi:hypothetical protein
MEFILNLLNWFLVMFCIRWMLVIYFCVASRVCLCSYLKTRGATTEETRLPRLFAREDAQPLLLYDDYRAGVMSLPTM